MGMASTGSITDCYNVATVTGGHPRYDKSGVGGIVGLFNECTTTNSYNYGTVSRNKDSVDCAMGGAIGFDRKSSTGKLEEVAAKAENSGSIRFCYGISADQYGSAAGKWLAWASSCWWCCLSLSARIRRTKLHREKALRPTRAAGLSCPRLCRRGGDFAPPEPFFLLCICRRHGMIISVMSKGKHA